jgi:hypothetical protein
MRRGEQIDIRQCGRHTARRRLVTVPTDQRIEPDDALATAPKRRHFRAEHVGRAGIVTVGKDHHAGARMNDAHRMPAIKASQTVADSRTATDAFRHQAETIKRLARVLLAQSVGDMNQACVKQEGICLEEMIKDAVHETHEDRRVEIHRA